MRLWLSKNSEVALRDQAGAAAGEEIELDRLVSTLFQIARQKGYSVAEISSRVERWLRFRHGRRKDRQQLHKAGAQSPASGRVPAETLKLDSFRGLDNNARLALKI